MPSMPSHGSGSSWTPSKPSTRAMIPASSSISRRNAAVGDSPPSIWPHGMVHRPSSEMAGALPNEENTVSASDHATDADDGFAHRSVFIFMMATALKCQQSIVYLTSDEEFVSATREPRSMRCDWGLGRIGNPDSGFLLSLTLLFDSVVVRLGPVLFLPSCWTMSVGALQ